MKGVSAIIVCYYPLIKKLQYLCEVLSKDGLSVILINNGEDLNLVESDGLTIKNLGSNKGIAHAQNIGIQQARKNGSNIVVFFDQDSVIGEGFVEKLIEPLLFIEYGVASPIFYDEKKGFEFPSLILNKWGFPRPILNSSKNEKPYLTDLIISSGSAVTIHTFEKVGDFDESFFIDFVDLEWALRCKKMDVPIWVVPTAKMKHSIGERSINLKVLRIFIHNPIRSYYKLRNTFLFFRKDSVPKFYAIKEILTALIHQFVALFFVKQEMKYFKMYFKAIFDGLLNRGGELK